MNQPMVFQLNTAPVPKTVFVLILFFPLLNMPMLSPVHNPACVLAQRHIGPSLSSTPYIPSRRYSQPSKSLMIEIYLSKLKTRAF